VCLLFERALTHTRTNAHAHVNVHVNVHVNAPPFIHRRNDGMAVLVFGIPHERFPREEEEEEEEEEKEEEEEEG